MHRCCIDLIYVPLHQLVVVQQHNVSASRNLLFNPYKEGITMPLSPIQRLDSIPVEKRH